MYRAGFSRPSHRGFSSADRGKHLSACRGLEWTGLVVRWLTSSVRAFDVHLYLHRSLYVHGDEDAARFDSDLEYSPYSGEYSVA